MPRSIVMRKGLFPPVSGPRMRGLKPGRNRGVSAIGVIGGSAHREGIPEETRMKSVSGAAHAFFHENGILHAIRLGGIGSEGQSFSLLLNKELVFSRQQDEASFLWLDFFGMAISKRNKGELSRLLAEFDGKIRKCAVVGINSFRRAAFKRELRRKSAFNVEVAHFRDTETARRWLKER